MIFLRGTVAVLLAVVLMAVSSPSVSAKSISVSNQIVVTATILPARYVIIDADDKVLQIISNTTERKVGLSVYRGSVKPDNAVASSPKVESDVAKLLSSKTIKPGILYDRKTEAFINELKLSGIFNLRNLSPTVNLVSSQIKP